MHLTDLTQGTIYRGNDGEEWRITSSMTNEDKMFIELEKVGNEQLQELIKE